MKNIKIKSATALAILFLLVMSSFTTKSNFKMRKIIVAGIIVNAQTLKPLEKAKLYDRNNNLVGETNTDGYFKIDVNVSNIGPINFKLKIEKTGYKQFIQTENWADLGENVSAVMYFGLKNLNTATSAFSELFNLTDNVSYDNVINGFSKIKEKRKFESELSVAEQGNENVFVSLEDGFYLVNNTGWIKIDSKDDLVSINGHTVASAEDLNKVVLRKNIKSMTPLEGRKEKYAVYEITPTAVTVYDKATK